MSLTKCSLGTAAAVVGMDQTVMAGTATLAAAGMAVDHVVVVVVTDMAVDVIALARMDGPDKDLGFVPVYDESSFHQ
jgi:hypothetical protein